MLCELCNALLLYICSFLLEFLGFQNPPNRSSMHSKMSFTLCSKRNIILQCSVCKHKTFIDSKNCFHKKSFSEINIRSVPGGMTYGIANKLEFQQHWCRIFQLLVIRRAIIGEKLCAKSQEIFNG